MTGYEPSGAHRWPALLELVSTAGPPCRSQQCWCKSRRKQLKGEGLQLHAASGGQNQALSLQISSRMATQGFL